MTLINIVFGIGAISSAIFLFFFLKDRWFPERIDSATNKLLHDAYIELFQEIDHIEKIAKYSYSDRELKESYAVEFPYQDILKTARILLKIKHHKRLCLKIIKIIEKRDKENIRKNAKILFKYTNELLRKLIIYKDN